MRQVRNASTSQLRAPGWDLDQKRMHHRARRQRRGHALQERFQGSHIEAQRRAAIRGGSAKWLGGLPKVHLFRTGMWMDDDSSWQLQPRLSQPSSAFRARHKCPKCPSFHEFARQAYPGRKPNRRLQKVHVSVHASGLLQPKLVRPLEPAAVLIEPGGRRSEEAQCIDMGTADTRLDCRVQRLSTNT
eukprot:scaffold151957_cov33-Tisochrysis_lutea.AAC.2